MSEYQTKIICGRVQDLMDVLESQKYAIITHAIQMYGLQMTAEEAESFQFSAVFESDFIYVYMVSDDLELCLATGVWQDGVLVLECSDPISLEEMESAEVFEL